VNGYSYSFPGHESDCSVDNILAVVSLFLCYWQHWFHVVKRQVKAVFAVIIIGLFSILCVKFVSRKLCGVTGDIFGAINEITEVLFLIIVVL
jgi:cobalamin synthase